MSRGNFALAWSALLSCGAGIAACAASPSGTAPEPTPGPLPTLSLTPGEFTFRVDGTPRVVMTRNITGQSAGQIEALLDQASTAGTTVIRMHLIHGLGGGVTTGGAVSETWASQWDAVFDHAQAVGLYVIPVFGVWADWNDGTPDYGFANWTMNPWNVANGGPASAPSELWQRDSTVRGQWMAWLRALVERWHGRANIAAWEPFSELDIASGVTEASAAEFAADAAAVVRAGDSAGRPVMASLTALDDWPTLNASDSVDILQVHTYADPLDAALLSSVAALRAEYGKPVLIGESGLSAAAPTGNTPTTEPQAAVEISHAIWAGVVSGAMNARGLWWEDGYAVYEPPGLGFVDSYAHAETAAAKFASGLDCTGAAPLTVALSPDLLGGALGSAALVLGWVRNGACAPPSFACDTALEGKTINLYLPAGAHSWKATFFDTATGGALPGSTLLTGNGTVAVPLPPIEDDLAFTLVLADP